MWILWVVIILLVWLGSRETYIPAPNRLVPHDPNKIPLTEEEFNKFYFGTPKLYQAPNSEVKSEEKGFKCTNCFRGQYTEAPTYW
jgi:hypothetical protein